MGNFCLNVLAKCHRLNMAASGAKGGEILEFSNLWVGLLPHLRFAKHSLFCVVSRKTKNQINHYKK